MKWLRWLAFWNYCERDLFPVLPTEDVDGKRLCSGCADLYRMEAEGRYY